MTPVNKASANLLGLLRSRKVEIRIHHIKIHIGFIRNFVTRKFYWAICVCLPLISNSFNFIVYSSRTPWYLHVHYSWWPRDWNTLYFGIPIEKGSAIKMPFWPMHKVDVLGQHEAAHTRIFLGSLHFDSAALPSPRAPGPPRSRLEQRAVLPFPMVPTYDMRVCVCVFAC